jgi:hypothetical protein
VAKTVPDLRIAKGFTLPPQAVTQTFAIMAMRGAGKRLWVDTPIPTPAGWTTMGDLEVGDVIFDDQGLPCTVTGAHEVDYGDSYRVHFSDGTSIVADAEHLWRTTDCRTRKVAGLRSGLERRRGGPPNLDWVRTRPQSQRQDIGPAVRTTAEIAATLMHGKERNHSIDNASPLELPESDLSIPPYLLGLWLGDGHTAAGLITSADPEVIDEVEALGWPCHVPPSGEQDSAARIYRVAGLTKALRLLGVLHNKHVPTQYLRASVDQRLELLRGLLDSDGGWSRSSVEFTSTKEELADAVDELVVSLGMRCFRRKRAARLDGVDHGVAHVVSFSPTMQVFRLPRKAERWRPDRQQQSRQRRRFITAVEPMPSVLMRCISVDSPSHLFLAGRQMVPTHNTTTSGVMVEEMVKAGLPTCVVDPIGVWFGLRSSADGKSPGLPVVILGGEHGDAPLLPTAGAVVAEMLVEHPFPVVLDLSLMSKTKARQFMVDFLETLYHRNRKPLHLVLDEADRWAPQRVPKGGERLLGACEDVVRLGRARGLGVTLISQRPAVVNKDVLSQTEVLIAMRVTSSHDRKAIFDWVDEHVTAEERREMVSSLPSLPTGTAWVCSPSWLKLIRQIEVRRKETFDSSATPEIGASVVAPTAFAAVDLDVLQEKMAETIERAAETDPKAMRRRILELTRDLAAAKAAAPAETVEVERIVEVEVRVPYVPDDVLAALDEAGKRLALAGSELVSVHSDLLQATSSARDITAAAPVAAPPLDLSRPSRPARRPRPAPGPSRPSPRRSAAAVPESGVTGDAGILERKAEGLFMAALVQHPEGLTRARLAFFTGYSVKSSSVGNALGALRSEGFITKSGEPILATAEGIAAAGEVAPLPSGDELYRLIQSKLGKAEKEILDLAVVYYPEPISKELIEAETPSRYSVKSSSVGNALGRLRTLAMLDGWAASDDLLSAIS